ncbi:nucleoside 2-deoxyribosyltransferase [Aliterella atlantica]|uniref:Nucleoside 2-deoxyribosyltransferase n=1 Tax=Aliterella atlantica CENA595 TaxID=1618023 RepID=A0A0D8ZSB2_9CYAN|nr:nucleoside 2-deoxyribosyltransferase [Aliterella atlantica]KJH70116.1 nucleoside 2-deoxyribosyltransferase [Aliterella atlantica CENA595]
MNRKKIYLANPYGFSQQQKTLLLPIIEVLESLGAEVWEPFARNNQIDISQAGWAYLVAQADVNDVKNCDGIFAIVNGTPPDEGVMVELGIAIACNKAIFLFRDDFRRCTDSESYPLNLMLFAGLPAIGWEKYYYTSLAEISSQQKALYSWLTSS